MVLNEDVQRVNHDEGNNKNERKKSVVIVKHDQK